MSEIEWTLLAHLLPLVIWLQLVPSATTPGQAAVMLLGAALVVALATAVAHRARRGLVSCAGAPGIARQAGSPTSAPPRRRAAGQQAGDIAGGGRGARAPGVRIRRSEQAAPVS